MGLLADTDPPLDGDTPSLQLIVLLPEFDRVEHHTITQETAFSRVEDPRRNLMQNEFIVSGMYRVTGVGPTLVTGHDMHVPGEDIDELALPFVTPLATHNYHAVAGISISRHGVIPRWKARKCLRIPKKKTHSEGNGPGWCFL